MSEETDVALRPVIDSDLDHFFEHQQDEEACFMAAFVAPDPRDRAAFDQHWRKIRALESVLIATIVKPANAVGNTASVVGHIASFDRGDEREVTYWIAREYWGRGVATAALRRFLERDLTRPIFARVAKDNAASSRVLKKCGYRLAREERGFAEARNAEIEELVFSLSASRS